MGLYQIWGLLHTNSSTRANRLEIIQRCQITRHHSLEANAGNIRVEYFYFQIYHHYATVKFNTTWGNSFSLFLQVFDSAFPL